MPNGKKLPCCSSCKWAQWQWTDKGVFIRCQHHNVTIRHGAAFFCKNLSHDRAPELAQFASAPMIEVNTIYEWVSGAANDDSNYSYFPSNYTHPYVKLVSVDAFADWDEQTIYARIVQNRQKRLYQVQHARVKR
ncbi:MAG: hypothetical protein KF716_00440 [Anaerolineae bacterium]|nr:hypothetical protein [Anaerolineae bacterium]